MSTSPTVAFDLDQTLVDSRERIVESFRSAFRSMGSPDVQPAAFDPWFGYPLETILEGVAPGTDAGVFVPAYRRAYDTDKPGEAPAMPGAREALTWLQAHGYRVVVVSAKATAAVGVALADAGLDDLVDVCYGDFFGEAKAVPIRDEGARYYVGDHVADMHAARRADATGIAVGSGSHDEAALREAGAAVVIPTLADLPGAITELAR